MPSCSCMRKTNIKMKANNYKPTHGGYASCPQLTETCTHFNSCDMSRPKNLAENQHTDTRGCWPSVCMNVVIGRKKTPWRYATCWDIYDYNQRNPDRELKNDGTKWLILEGWLVCGKPAEVIAAIEPKHPEGNSLLPARDFKTSPQGFAELHSAESTFNRLTAARLESLFPYEAKDFDMNCFAKDHPLREAVTKDIDEHTRAVKCADCHHIHTGPCCNIIHGSDPCPKCGRVART